LPGSRKEEIKHLLPDMIQAAEIIASRYPDLHCVLPLAPTISRTLVETVTGPCPVDVTIFEGSIYTVLKVCDAALVTSGTATLEAAMMGVPMVIAYRVSPLSYWVGKRVIKVPHIGLVNLVAGEDLVPELIQNEATPDALAREALRVLEAGQYRKNMIEKMNTLRESMGEGNPSERTARIALDMMKD
jgi:lipid-A-disaccharide synthase